MSWLNRSWKPCFLFLLISSLGIVTWSKWHQHRIVMEHYSLEEEMKRGGERKCRVTGTFNKEVKIGSQNVLGQEGVISFKGASVPMSSCCLMEGTWQRLYAFWLGQTWCQASKWEGEWEKESLTVEGTKQQVQATPLVILLSTHTLTSKASVTGDRLG